jgi:hypothetical protein
VAGRDVAGALIAAFATHYRCELPGDADVLERVRARYDGDTGDALMNLVVAGTVRPAGIFRAGLAILAVLADLCRNGSDSILQRAALSGLCPDRVCLEHERSGHGPAQAPPR